MRFRHKSISLSSSGGNVDVSRLRKNWAVVFTISLTAVAACTSTESHDATPAPPPLSPIQEFTSAAFGTDLSSEAQRQRIEELIMRRQEVIAQCMNEAGFEYIPTISNLVIGSSSEGPQIRPDDREWVAQWGYGIVDTPLGEPRFTTMWSEDLPPNPNDEIVAALTEAETAAYWEALNGPPPEWTEYINGVGIHTGTVPWEQQGCFGRAWIEVPISLLSTDEFAPLQDAITQFEEDFRKSPPVVLIENDWANCMAGKGHTGLTEQRDAEWRLNNQFANRFPTRGSRNPVLRAVIEFQEREIAMALDDLDCREEFDYRTRMAEARLAAETQFVEDNRAALEAFRSAAEQHG